MSLALIQESAKEVRRLAIAGSPLAVGDFRLKKLVAPLKQAGAKVPVFAQVAKAISDVVNGKEADSAANLLSLSTLLNAILYTQGQSGTEAAVQELEVFSSNSATTRTTARVLKPIIAALTSSGAGRFETVKAAVERGAFNDLRLIEPAIGALSDNFPELADLVAEKILPAYGPGIVPLLKQNLDLKGKRSDARRLSVLHHLDSAGALPLCKTALDEGSPEVKAAALACLGKHEEHLPLVLEQTASKNKTVRAAALQALAGYDRAEVNKVFIDLIQGKSLEILSLPLRVTRSRPVLDALYAEGRRVFGVLIGGDEDQIPRYAELLECLHERPEAEEFLLHCFNETGRLLKIKAPKNSHLSGADLAVMLTSMLHAHGSKQALEAVLAKRDLLPAMAFPQVVRCALRTWPSEKVYEEFAPLLAQKKGAAKEKGEYLQRVILEARWEETSRFDPLGGEDSDPDDRMLRSVKWDPRWLDAAIKADTFSVVCALAQPGHKAALDYLLKKLGTLKSGSDAGWALLALARCHYPKITDCFLDQVARKTKGARYLDYELQFLLECARHLPPADLPRLDEFAATLDEKFMDGFLEALAPLRAAPQAAQK